MAEPMFRKRVYVLTYLILLALVLLTTLLGYIDMGPFSMTVAIVIAAVQASLIAGFFMQGALEPALVRVAAAAGIIWFLILTTLTLTDYITRGWLPFPGK